MVGGKLVCDLWGGHRDAARQTPWARDTLVNFFSVGKAFTALVALRLVERGALDLDAPAHRLWPEFGANGKEGITLRHMLSHQAGLPAIREELPGGAMLDWDRMTAALAAQAPWWPPGTAHGYHVNTYGYLVGELVRRASGRTIGEILRDEIRRPAQCRHPYRSSAGGACALRRVPLAVRPAGAARKARSTTSHS